MPRSTDRLTLRVPPDIRALVESRQAVRMAAGEEHRGCKDPSGSMAAVICDLIREGAKVTGPDGRPSAEEVVTIPVSLWTRISAGFVSRSVREVDSDRSITFMECVDCEARWADYQPERHNAGCPLGVIEAQIEEVDMGIEAAREAP